MEELIDTIVYAGRLKDKSALMSSSSGKGALRPAGQGVRGSPPLPRQLPQAAV